MSVLKKWQVVPFFPLPRSRDRWRVVAGPHVGTRHFGGGGGGGALVGPLLARLVG